MLFNKLIKQSFKTIEGDWDQLDELSGVGTDTRVNLTNKLFVPLTGENFDGHHFITQAINQGAQAALWQKDQSRPEDIPSSFPLVRVDDPLEGLQQLAQNYLEAINPKVIAITGSNGKTTTKDLVYSVCRTTYKTHCTDGNFNNHIGLPLTILSMSRETEVLILEMGMSHFGEIELLSQISKPDIAIITNIGESHIEYLGSRAGIAKAKLEVVTNLKQDGLLIYDGDEPLLQAEHAVETASVGFEQTSDYWIKNCHVMNDGTKFEIDRTDQTLSIPLIGKHQAKNATYCYVVGEKLGISFDQIQQGLANNSITNMRFERIEGKHGTVLINDAYNASPTSMGVTIEAFTQLEGYKEKILVLGDMLELGPESNTYHKSVGEMIPKSIDFLFTFGDEAKFISQSTTIESKHFETKEALVSQLAKKQAEGTIILFKASRGLQFEQLIELLLE